MRAPKIVPLPSPVIDEDIQPLPNPRVEAIRAQLNGAIKIDIKDTGRIIYSSKAMSVDSKRGDLPLLAINVMPDNNGYRQKLKTNKASNCPCVVM